MSNVNIENLVYDAVGEGFDLYHREELGSEKRKAAYNEATQLLDRVIEIERIEVEREDKAAVRENEKLMKERQLRFEKGKLAAEITVGAVTLLANMLFTGRVIKRSMDFERTDTFTSTTGREYIKRGVLWVFKK